MGVTLRGLSSSLPSTWQTEISVDSSVWEKLEAAIDLAGDELSPPRELIFAALSIPPSHVKTVILGQDPYPNRSDAVGLAFSVPRSSKLPPTLRNIFQEYSTDLEMPIPSSGDLRPWVQEGVLLLNTTLTCLDGESLSHSEIGWQEITEQIVKSAAKNGATAILWGSHAQKYGKYFATEEVVSSVHPSPLSAYRGFFGSRPFTRTNQILQRKGVAPITWRLPDVSRERD